MSGLNTSLLQSALTRVNEKRGFVPSDAAANQGQPPPGADPNAAPPPMDQAAGGAPPMPPDPGAGMPPGPGGPPPVSDPTGLGDGIASQVAAGVAQALGSSGLQGNKQQGQAKPDINTIATDIFQLKMMFQHYLRIQGIDLPESLLVGANRSAITGAAEPGVSGGSDTASANAMNGPQGNSAIKPIQPIQGAFPGAGAGGGGATKTSSVTIGQEITGHRVMSKAAAVALMLRRQQHPN
jgi:hypothetical protein